MSVTELVRRGRFLILIANGGQCGALTVHRYKIAQERGERGKD
jgi:hypothetical protein